VLIILPPSESKREAPEVGQALAIEELSFRGLRPMRELVLDALIETSDQPDAMRRLLVGPALVHEVARNLSLRSLPTRPAVDVYSGPLHAGLSAATFSDAARQTADESLVVTSALWGLLRPKDRIPPYRLHVCARLVGMDRLEPSWRTVLPAVMADAAGPDGVVLDLRSPAYQALGMPAGLTERTATLRVLPEAGARAMGNVDAKRLRGEVARYLLHLDSQPSDPAELAGVVGERWPARLEPPSTPNRRWTLLIRPRD
jgi:cytoplasmic iron level regulating protein YaaA (DUF328/UPF0246 family)